MKVPGTRLAQLAAVAVSTLSLGTITAAATPAVAQPPICGGTDCPSLAPAGLSASQGTLNITSMQLENITASATDVRTGRPLVGALIRFYTSGGRLLGSAYTNYGGMAGITASENLGPGTIQELLNGYDAVLVGDGVYVPATAHAAITIGTDCASTPPPSDRRLKCAVVPVDWSR
ncbi:hypothetical protein P3T27_004967 [Kitasatospora sp. MAA19]|uniref:hypothetical protein n=1 Tax=unclassified Kitasatospora TaxID=2633591 RepID=UPI00247476C9|nr:hypothetical protein [Kitasatospora sp. MAA19]MDH6708228.1 hypothetical protein [Kitasatospora sp. MAA19]